MMASQPDSLLNAFASQPNTDVHLFSSLGLMPSQNAGLDANALLSSPPDVEGSALLGQGEHSAGPATAVGATSPTAAQSLARVAPVTGSLGGLGGLGALSSILPFGATQAAAMENDPIAAMVSWHCIVP